MARIEITINTQKLCSQSVLYSEVPLYITFLVNVLVHEACSENYM